MLTGGALSFQPRLRWALSSRSASTSGTPRNLLTAAVNSSARQALLPRRRRRAARVGATLRTYSGLLTDRVFIGLILTAGLVMSGMFAYIAGSSFVFQEEFGLDEQGFGLLFGVGAIWIIGASQINAYLLRWLEPRQLLPAAVLAGTAAGLVLLAASLTGFGGLAGVLVPLWAVLFTVGLALPNAPALALSRHGEAAGTAASLLGAVQFGTGAIVSPLVGIAGNDATAMGAIVATAMALALVVLVFVVRPWRLAGRVASMPSQPGIWTSISTTSGRSVAARWTAASPSAASPTTSMPAAEPRITRKPARTTAWSSATSTRIVTSGSSQVPPSPGPAA